MEYSKKMKELSESIFKYLLVFSFISLLLTITYFILSTDSISNKITTSAGYFIIPCVMLVTALVTLIAFWAQIDANKKIQDQFRIQQFESQFFEMLKLHKENVNEMKIEGYGRLLGYNYSGHKKMNDKFYSEEASSTNLTQHKRFIEKRKVFFCMNTELIACKKLVLYRYKVLKYFKSINESEKEKFEKKIKSYDLINKEKINNIEKLTDYERIKAFENEIDLKNKLDDIELTTEEESQLLKLSYNIFFFGVKSEMITCNTEIINEKDLEKIKEYLKQIRNKHKETFGDVNKIPISENDEAKIYIKYNPLSGHENRLGHYYRHLYATVKYVVEQEDKLFDYKKSREYLKLLRSQLSNDEFLLLYYNFLYGYGKNWDSKQSSVIENKSKDITKGERNQFFTKYRMLHNIPLSRVYPKSMSPENIFEKYNKELSNKSVIENHKIDKDDDLFEWEK